MICVIFFISQQRDIHAQLIKNEELSVKRSVTNILIIVLPALLAMGCNKASKTEDWYINHHDDLVKKYTDCFKSMDQVSAECVAAIKAYHKERDKPDVRAAMIAAKKQMNGSFNVGRK